MVIHQFWPQNVHIQYVRTYSDAASSSSAACLQKAERQNATTVDQLAKLAKMAVPIREPQLKTYNNMKLGDTHVHMWTFEIFNVAPQTTDISKIPWCGPTRAQ